MYGLRLGRPSVPPSPQVDDAHPDVVLRAPYYASCVKAVAASCQKLLTGSAARSSLRFPPRRPPATRDLPQRP
eukprot:CAMPEP_0182568822 /NCGR_PEP_ID=MMETSP1324-20130603/9644_1 /TAXON_ID=236786 /ORGANISM="Florenciella sp., Strain RCC1587" /LENGTH=72 /DNA_ID=CAMNT_0024783011 /DNA_START=83 /DNA_END=299 /DNA_ORIENTATION=-